MTVLITIDGMTYAKPLPDSNCFRKSCKNIDNSPRSSSAVSILLKIISSIRVFIIGSKSNLLLRI